MIKYNDALITFNYMYHTGFASLQVPSGIVYIILWIGIIYTIMYINYETQPAIQVPVWVSY